MGCRVPSEQAPNWGHPQLLPTNLPERDVYYDKVQTDINEFFGMKDDYLYALDKFMYSVDMDIFEFAGSREGIIGLIYAIAARCSDQAQLEGVFEPKLVAPFVYFNSQHLQDLAPGCEALKNLIKIVTESESKLETLKARFTEYSNKATETSNGVTAQMEGTFDIGLLGKIRAIKNAEYNAKIMK